METKDGKTAPLLDETQPTIARNVTLSRGGRNYGLFPTTYEESEIKRDVIPETSHNFVAALLCCFLSVTGGVSLGGIIFPQDAQHKNGDFQAVGIQIGLLAAAVSMWVAYFKSQLYLGVAGGIFPPVITLSSTFFHAIGAENPHTIMFALPLITTINGLAIYFAAWLPLERIVKGIPYIVFGGFMAATGVVLLRCGLEMAAGCPMQDGQFWEQSNHWLPSIIVAFLVFVAQEMGSPAKEMLLPISLLLMFTGFYMVRWISGGGFGLDGARALGYLYDVQVPTTPGFYHVWTLQDMSRVNFDLLWKCGLGSAILNSLALSILCIVEDLFGVAEATNIKINMEKEIKASALMNVVAGLVGSMPTNLVMSYSISAHKSGAKSKAFLLYLAIVTSIIFLLADYVIAVMPKMIPATASIWIGIAMCWDWLYKGFKKLRRADYCVIWIMIIVNFTHGSGVMIGVGICVTCFQLALRLSSIKVLDEVHTLCHERSSKMYPLAYNKVFENHGEEVLIFHLAQGLLFFGSAFQIQERVEECLRNQDKPKPKFLVLDLTEVEDTEVSGIKILHYIVHEIAAEHNFVVVFVGISDRVRKQFSNFSRDDPNNVERFETVDEGLAYVEAALFKIHGRKYIHAGTDRNPNLPEVRELVRSLCSDSEFCPVAVDVHCWLNGYVDDYAAQIVLPALVRALEMKEFQESEDVTDVPIEWTSVDMRSPMVWVLSGSVDMVRDDVQKRKDGACPMEMQGTGFLKWQSMEVLQAAQVDIGGLQEATCAGPFDTLDHFSFSFQFPKVRVRVKSHKAKVALLSRRNFEDMPRNVAGLLAHYCARKRNAWYAFRH